MTRYEKQMAKNLRRWGIKYRSQRMFDFYIVDFLLPDRRIAIEVDGYYHEERKEYDTKRDKYLSKLGLTIIRIKNEDVFNCEWLKDKITKSEKIDTRSLPQRLSYGKSKY